MQVVQFDAFGALPYLAQRPVPTPRPHGVVIEVKATGLCRSDWHGWQGHDPDITTLPHIPGHEFAGIVSQIGDQVTTIAVGQRVTVPFMTGCGDCRDCRAGDAQVCKFGWQPGFSGPGSFAQFVAIPHADFNVVPLPDAIGFDEAAGLGCRFATAYRAVVHVAKITKDDSVAVFGCGGVGLSAIMIAKSRGARVVAVDSSHGALDRARLAGADAVVDTKYDDVIRQVRSFDVDGVCVSIDALGSVDTANAAVSSLRRRGRHVQVGLLPPAVIGDRATVPMHTVIGLELQILGSHGMAASAYPAMLSEIAEGTLRPETLIERVISLEQVPEALSTMGHTPAPGVTVIHP